MQGKSQNDISLFVKLLGFYFLALILGAINIGSMGSALKLVGLLPAALWLLNKRKLEKNSLYYGVLLHAVWAFFSVFWSIDFNNSISNCVSLFSFCLMLMAASSYTYSKIELTLLKNMLCWSSRITVITALLSGQYYQGRLFFNGMISEDPNYLCGYFFFGIADCVLSLYSAEKKKHKFFRAIELGTYVYAIVATGSRGGAIAVAVTALTISSIMMHRQKLSRKIILSRIAVMVVLMIVFWTVTNYIPADILSRFSIDDVKESNAAGRFDIWRDTLSTYRNAEIGRQIGGFGTATSLAVSKQMNFQRIGVSHNAFLSNLIELGAIGILLYAMYLFVFVRYVFVKQEVFSLAIMLGLIALSMSVSITVFKPYWNIMLYICCFSKSDLAVSKNSFRCKH